MLRCYFILIWGKSDQGDEKSKEEHSPSSLSSFSKEIDYNYCLCLIKRESMSETLKDTNFSVLDLLKDYAIKVEADYHLTSNTVELSKYSRRIRIKYT